jgi:hypothetical protein
MNERDESMNIAVYMDQGLVVDLRQHGLYSQQFSSCAPILLYNSVTQKGGLYHFAGGAIRDYQSRHLRLMSSVVQPTDVYIFRGLGTFDYATMGMIVTTSHIAGVQALFQGIANVHHGHNGRLNVGSIWAGAPQGALTFDFQWSNEPGLRLRTLAAIRSLPDGVMFFGEDDDAELAKWM